MSVTGLFIVTRAFGDAMTKSGGGSIINIGSVPGIVDIWTAMRHAGRIVVLGSGSAQRRVPVPRLT